MAFGISTNLIHLDPLSPPVDLATVELPIVDFDWPDFYTWYDNSYPDFAGRPFLGGDFLWAHGEGKAAAKLAPALTHIVPIHAADPVRMAITGTDGFMLGVTDAAAFCDRIRRCINDDELTLPTNDLLVFLDVPAGTVLSADYWAGWATTVYAAPVSVVEDVSGATVAPSIKMPFAPAILCKFTLGADQSTYTLDASVFACLNAVEADYPNEQVACYGFWAVAADSPAYIGTPKPLNLDWKVFTPYSQPIEMKATQLVPVVMWRYGVPLGPAWAAGNPVNVDAANDDFKPLDSMLGIKSSWFITADSATSWGFETDRETTTHADDISKARMTYTRTAVGYPPFQIANQPVDFVGRYFDNLPATWEHRLAIGEADALARVGIEVFTCWQSPVPPTVDNNNKATGQWPNKPVYFTSGFGSQDAQAAFAMASQYGQPAHTPVYFAVDSFLPEVNYPDLRTYFRDILSGYQAYLAKKNGPFGGEPTPYAIGVYGGATKYLGSSSVLNECYRQGIASYFWQAVKFDESQTVPWPHANLWQRTLSPETDNFKVCKLPNGSGGLNADINESWGDPGSWYRLTATVTYG
jgi:Domain of unknown function (DUF1906)